MHSCIITMVSRNSPHMVAEPGGSRKRIDEQIVEFSIKAGEGLLVELKVKGSITELISRLPGETSSETKQKACFDEETWKADTAKHSSILDAVVSRSTLDSEVSSRDRTLQCTVEQILDIPVPETAKQLAEMPKIVSQDRIQERTVEQTIDILVPQDVEEVEEFFKASSQDRVQQRFREQIIEPPATSLAEKIVEMPVTQMREETKQVVNTHVQHVVNAVEAEKPIINEKINQVTKHVEIPQLQIVEKTAKTPETQITQGTETSESMGNATARQVVEIEAYLPAESASPMFVSKPVSETLSVVVEYIQPTPVHVEYGTPAPTVAQTAPVTTSTVAPTVFPTTVPIATAQIATGTDTPVAQQSLLPTAQTVQKTEEIPQVRHIDKVVGVPVVDQRQTPTIHTEQKTTDVPQIQCFEPLVDVPVVKQQMAEIPVVMLKQVPAMMRRQIPLVSENPEDGRGAPDPIHRQGG